MTLDEQLDGIRGKARPRIWEASRRITAGAALVVVSPRIQRTRRTEPSDTIAVLRSRPR